jgi:hypothetical protein
MTGSDTEEYWTPTFIDIETRLSEFVFTFRNGAKVTELVPEIPSGTLNADFFLPIDKVIVELKCLENDPSASEID